MLPKYLNVCDQVNPRIFEDFFSFSILRRTAFLLYISCSFSPFRMKLVFLSKLWWSIDILDCVLKLLTINSALSENGIRVFIQISVSNFFVFWTLFKSFEYNVFSNFVSMAVFSFIEGLLNWNKCFSSTIAVSWYPIGTCRISHQFRSWWAASKFS